MSEPAGNQSLQNLGDLLTSLGVESLDEASGAISEDTEVDADLVQDGNDLVLRMGRFGSHITFPTSVDDFWQLVDDLEEEVVAAWESESDQGAEVPGWDAPELFPREPKRTGKYRRLQSWYRERVLQVAPGPYKTTPHWAATSGPRTWLKGQL